MTEPDIIRIDGVEYEPCDCDTKTAIVIDMGSNSGGEWYRKFRPMRKQTGWICRSGYGCALHCVAPMDGMLNMRPDRCLYYTAKDESVWDPFYGKVVEE
jgi:hypothetical protein